MNKAPLLLTLLVLLTAAAGAFLVWSSGGDNGGVRPNAPEALPADDPETVGPIVADADWPVDDQPKTGAPLPDDLLRTEVAASTTDVGSLVVQVWDGKPGVPAALAEVFFLDGFDGPELGDPFAQHWSALAEDRGRRFRTDTQGLVELLPVREWAIVTAQRPGSYGFAKVGREHRELEIITLRPDETVTVLVLDGEDRPAAGVPVGVVQRVPVREDPKQWVAQIKQLEQRMKEVERWMQDNPAQRERAMPRVQGIRDRQARLKAQFGKNPNRRGTKITEQSKPAITERPELRARRRTDETGIAVFRHFQAYRHQRDKWWPAENTDQFEAVLLMPLQEPETRAFEGRPVPTETIELRMPPTGSIALRTIDSDGRPFTHPVHADLRIHDGQNVPWGRVQVRKEQNEAVIEFPFVGLGLQFTAQCRLDDNDFRWTAPPFAGPVEPGQRLIVDLVVAPGEGMLCGRLLDGAGTPLADARPTFLINGLAGRLEGEAVTLDDAGRFHLPYQVRPQHRGPFRLEIRRDDVAPTAGLAMALPALPEGVVTDLGDLQIDAFGQIVHGVVIDDRGQPIAGASVQLQRERPVGGDQSKMEFVDEAFAVARTDAEGHYELFGELEPGRYRVRVQAQDHFPYESYDLQGGEQVDPELLRKSRVVGTVLAPEWMPRDGLRVKLVSAFDATQVREDQVHDHEGQTYVYFDWVRAGIYNVQIRLQDHPDPFVQIDGLEIQPGQMGLHPRLQDLDLGAFLHHFELTAVDEHGQPLQVSAPLVARITRQDGSPGFVAFPWKGREINVFSVSPQLEVWPMAPGFRAEHTVLGQGRSEISFLRIPPVDLHVPGLVQLVGTTPVWLTMMPTGETGLPDRLEAWDQRSGRIARWFGGSRSINARLGPSDTVRMQPTQDGRYRVVARLGRRARGVRQVPVELGFVDVRLVPGAEPQRLTVAFDVDAVQQGLAQLAQQGAASGNGR